MFDTLITLFLLIFLFPLLYLSLLCTLKDGGGLLSLDKRELVVMEKFLNA
jgi:hypothetical protein